MMLIARLAAERRAAIAIYRSHKQSVSRAVFFPNGALIATAGADKSIKLWKLQPPPVAAGL